MPYQKLRVNWIFNIEHWIFECPMAKTECPTNFTFLDKLPTFYRRQLQKFGTFLNEMHSDFTPIYHVICYIIFIRLAIKCMPLNSTFKVRKITFISQTLKTEAVRYCLSRYGVVKFDPQTKYIGCIVNVTCNGMNNIMRNTQKRMRAFVNDYFKEHETV